MHLFEKEIRLSSERFFLKRKPLPCSMGGRRFWNDFLRKETLKTLLKTLLLYYIFYEKKPYEGFMLEEDL